MDSKKVKDSDYKFKSDKNKEQLKMFKHYLNQENMNS